MRDHEFPHVLTENIYLSLQRKDRLRRAVVAELNEIEGSGSEFPELDLAQVIEDRLTDAFAALGSGGRTSPEMKQLVTDIFVHALRSVDFEAIAEAFIDDQAGAPVRSRLW